MREIQRPDSRVSRERAGFLHVQVRARLRFVHKARVGQQRVRAPRPRLHARIRLRIPRIEERGSIRANNPHAVGRHGVRHRHERDMQRADLYLVPALDRMPGKERARGDRLERFKRFRGGIEWHAQLLLPFARVLLIQRVAHHQ